MQELVDEEGNLTLDQYDQHTGVDGDETVSPIGLRSWGGKRGRGRVSEERRREGRGDDAKGDGRVGFLGWSRPARNGRCRARIYILVA